MRKAYSILDYLISIIQGVQAYFMVSVWLMSIGILILFQENHLGFESNEQQQIMFLNMSALTFTFVFVLEICNAASELCKNIFCATNWFAKQVAIIGCYGVYRWYGSDNVAVFNIINMEYVLIFAVSIIILQHLLVIVKGMIWKKIRPVEVKSMGTACMVNVTKVDEEGKITNSESE